MVQSLRHPSAICLGGIRTHAVGTSLGTSTLGRGVKDLTLRGEERGTQLSGGKYPTPRWGSVPKVVYARWMVFVHSKSPVFKLFLTTSATCAIIRTSREKPTGPPLEIHYRPPCRPIELIRGPPPVVLRQLIRWPVGAPSDSPLVLHPVAHWWKFLKIP